MPLKDFQELDLKGKRVIARFDFNVPLNDEQEITDTTRIDLALPTIQDLLKKGVSKLVLMSHLGRPEGKPDPKLSLLPVANYLAQKLQDEVVLTDAAVDCGVSSLLSLKETKIVLLENLRFHPEETKNDREFAQKLAQYADYYINDAFGTAHRKHASTYMINAYFKGRAYAGYLLLKEVEALNKILEKPARPFVALIGGAKISDKIKTIERLIINVDSMCIGGAMAYPFLAAKNIPIGLSRCSQEDIRLAKKILALKSSSKIHLPVDHLVASELKSTQGEIATEIPEDKMGLDIGPQTIQEYSKILSSAATVLWNGPMGLCETPAFAEGTNAMATQMAKLNAYTLIGGGDSVAAVHKAELSQKMSHISTGGGASLEYIEEGSLPGINALKFGVDL